MTHRDGRVPRRGISIFTIYTHPQFRAGFDAFVSGEPPRLDLNPRVAWFHERGRMFGAFLSAAGAMPSQLPSREAGLASLRQAIYTGVVL